MSIKLEISTEQAQVLLQVTGKLLDALHCPIVAAVTQAPAVEKKVVKRRRRSKNVAPKEEFVIDVPDLPSPKRTRRKKNSSWRDSLKAPD